MPNNAKDVLSTESQNPKPKGPFGYSGNSVLGKVADLFANHAIFGDMKSREVPQGEVPRLNLYPVPGAPPGTVNDAQLAIVKMNYVSPESRPCGTTEQQESDP